MADLLSLVPYLPAALSQTGPTCFSYAAAHWVALMLNAAGFPQPPLSGRYLLDTWGRVRVSHPAPSGALDSTGNALLTMGMASEAAWPTARSFNGEVPDAAADADAATRKIDNYWMLPACTATQYGSADAWIEPVKAMLAQRIPVYCAFKVDPNFFYPVNGEIQPQTGPQYADGHEVLIVAWQAGRFLILNNGGPQWGGLGNGTAWMPEWYLRYLLSAWVATVRGGPEPVFYRPYIAPVSDALRDLILNSMQADLAATLSKLTQWSPSMSTPQQQQIVTDLLGIAANFQAQVRLLAASILPTPGPVTPPVPPASTGAVATFVKTDTTTQGNWRGKYGADGYLLTGSDTALPAYATVTPAGKSDWEWTPPAMADSDPRALQRVLRAGRIASCWYGPSPSVYVTFNDALAHQVALYCIDWDTHERRAKIEVLDANGTVVDTQQLATDYNGGRYLVWKVTGRATFRFTSLAGWNAVLSGIFFDPAA